MKLVYLWGGFLFKYRNTVFPLFLLVLFAAFRPVLAGGTLASDLWMDLAGLGVCLAGQALRVAVIGFAYIKRGGLNKKVYADTLVTRGIFGVMRNPLYVGNLLIAAGILMVHHHPAVYLIGGVFTMASYQAIVLTEERFLRDKFCSEFEDYCRGTSRWLPRLSKLRGATEGMAFDWRKPLLKDYSTCNTWLAIVALLFLYEAHSTVGGISPARLAGGIGLLLAAGTCSLAIHLVKKSAARKRRLARA